jgi:hypothetical protein
MKHQIERLESRVLMDGGGLYSTGHDVIPLYVGAPDTQTVQAGDWFAASTWSNGVPTAEDDALISHPVTLGGQTLTADFNLDGVVDKLDLVAWAESYGTPEWSGDFFMDWQQQLGKTAGGSAVVDDLQVDGALAIDATLTVKTLTVFGSLNVTGEVVFRDAPIDTAFDPQQFGHGMLVLGSGSLTANGATFRSENPEGVRGHVMAGQRAAVDIRDSLFEDLGRTTNDQLDNTHLGPNREVKHVGTNQVGRYTLHLHHLYGPEGLDADTPQFSVVNNTFRDGRKWAVAIHDSHYGLVEGNTIDGFDGAGIVCEDGSEYGNTIKGNTVRNIRGSGLGVQGRGNGNEPKLVGDGTPGNPYRTEGDHGHEGAALWVRGVANNIVDNVFEDAPFGSVIWSRFQPEDKIPAFKGADTHHDFKLVDHGLQHGFEFARNTFRNVTIAASWQGLGEETPGAVFIAKDLKSENVVDFLDTSYSSTIRFEGGDFKGVRSFATQMAFTDRVEIVGASITGFRYGVSTGRELYVEDSYFDCWGSDINMRLEVTEVYQRQNVLRNVRFSNSENNIGYRLGDYRNKRDYTRPLDVLVYDYNGVPGDNFQMWLSEQRGDYVMPVVVSNRGLRTTPEAGLTNQQLWDKYRLALAGKLLPEDATTREGINAPVTPIPADLQGPRITSAVYSATADSITIRWTTDEPAYSLIEWTDQKDITIEKYFNLIPTTELKTQHEVTITGLDPAKLYQYTIRVTDEFGNMTGPRLPGLNFSTTKVTTGAK